MTAPPLDVACAVATGAQPPPSTDRRLVVVFASAVAAELAHLATHVGYAVTLLDPTVELPGVPRVDDVAAAALDEDTDVVVSDHDRPELGEVLAGVLAQRTRWVGVMGSPRHSAPHVPALRALGVREDDIARVHRPIGLDIGSKAPGEIALSTIAGLLADRNGRSGGFYDRTAATAADPA